MALNEYLQQTQRLVNDPKTERFVLEDLKYYVNAARRHVAMETQCVRILPPSNGIFIAIPVTAGGSGYTSAMVAISAPDGFGVPSGNVQATATATVAAGAVTVINITNPGAGYVAAPTITITGNGTGATATGTLSAFLTTSPGQEVYKFSDVNPLAAAFPGVKEVVAVQTISVSWGSMRPTLRQMDWSGFQAYLRSTNIGSTNYPTVWAQYGQGATGSVYMYPVPATVSPMDWDCYCIPIDLVDDSTYDAIPYPWTDAVPYYAAYQAYMTAQDRDAADYMRAKYRESMTEGRKYASPAFVPDFYDTAY